jgi:diketogulonate reductase-like aldo/keto reductase
MQIPTKSLKNGFTMPVFGLGTWTIGGKREYNPDNDDQANIASIKNAIEAGITHIDTAESYADGYAETLVGKAIQGYEREKLFLVSKVRKEKLRYADLLQSTQQSLNRLQTNYLDLFLIHSPSESIAIEESMQAMTELKKTGLIKNIGVSNFSVQRFEAAQAVTSEPIVVNQLHLNLQYRETEQKGLVKFCQTNDVMFVAWRPLQGGQLAVEAGSLLKKISQKYHKTPNQIAINWLIAQKNLVTISMMKSAEHLRENLGAVDWQMDPADIELLRKNFPNQQSISDVAPLR